MAPKSHPADRMLGYCFFSAGFSRSNFAKAGGIIVIPNPGCAIALLRRSEAGCVMFGKPARQIEISEIGQVHPCVGEDTVVPGQPRVHFNEVVSAIFLSVLELQRSQP